MKNNSFIRVILLSLVLAGISGCSSQGVKSATGGPVVDLVGEFERGTLRLDCELSCAFAAGAAAKEVKSLYDQELWMDLVNKVADIGLKDQLSYFYLARAAEGLGYDAAAEQYYKLTLASLKCDAHFDNCSGIEVSRESISRLNRLSAKNVAVDDGSSKSTRDYEASKELHASSVSKGGDDSAESRDLAAHHNDAPAKEELASNLASSVSGQYHSQAVINESGFPEIFLPNMRGDKVISDLRGELVRKGWFISESSVSGFTAVREMDPARAAGERFAAAVLNGRKGYSYSDAIYFYSEDGAGGAVLMARPFIIKQSPGGQGSRSDQRDKEVVNQVVLYLNSVASKY